MGVTAPLILLIITLSQTRTVIREHPQQSLKKNLTDGGLLHVCSAGSEPEERLDAVSRAEVTAVKALSQQRRRLTGAPGGLSWALARQRKKRTTEPEMRWLKK